MSQLSTNTEIRSTIGSEVDQYDAYKVKIENAIIEEGPIQSSGTNPGHIFTVGVNEVNSKIGINEIGFDGEFITINDGDGATSIIRVINPQNRFIDHFNNDTFLDTSESTASIDTASGEVNFTHGDDLTSDVIYFDEDDVVNVRVQLFTNDLIPITNPEDWEIEISTDNKFSWSEIEHNVSKILSPTTIPDTTFPLTFPATFGGDISGPGNKMYYRIIYTGSTSDTLTDIKVFYNE